MRIDQGWNCAKAPDLELIYSPFLQKCTGRKVDATSKRRSEVGEKKAQERKKERKGSNRSIDQEDGRLYKIEVDRFFRATRTTNENHDGTRSKDEIATLSTTEQKAFGIAVLLSLVNASENDA
jgi:hypothetical protein